MLRPLMFTTLLLVAFSCTAPLGGAQGGLLREPDLHGDRVVFVHQGDLWWAPVAGGVAVRLTVDDGEEHTPRFSADGSQIAFTAEIDGNTDVFVMTADGGDITRVTYHPGRDVVAGWHPMNGKILFQSRRSSFNRFDQLFLIESDGSGLEPLPLHEASWGAFAPDGSSIVYNRQAREHRTWKRYRGGLAQDLWRYHFATGEDERLTNFEGTDRTPILLADGTLCFTSDRSYQLNLFQLERDSGGVTPLTQHERYDVLNPSLGDGGRIVYEHAGDLWLLDIEARQSSRIPIEVRADAPEARPFQKDVSEEVTHIAISPKGERALVVARGEVFSVPRKHGATRNLSRSSGSREKDAEFSPDGERVAWISDGSGEYSIHLADPQGREETIQLTHHDAGYRHTLRWSPDGTRIAFADQTLRCYLVDVGTGEITEVDRSASEPVDIGIDHKPIHDFTFSPDSRYLAYTKIDVDLVSKVYVYALETGQRHCISHGLYNDFGPAFSSDGQHLFFISNRHFDPTFCDFEWEMVYKKAAGIYVVALTAEAGPLFPPRSDDDSSEEGEEQDEQDSPPPVTADFTSIAARTEAVPVPRGNYRRLETGDGELYFLNGEQGDFNRFEYRGPGSQDLHALSFDSRKTRQILEGVSAYRLSVDRKSIVYRTRDEVGIVAASVEDSKGKALSLSGLTMRLDPREEWAQIYNEAWRMERDFFYEPSMHGLDWKVTGEKYASLLPRATCRQDVRFLVGELIGELNTSHTYVFGGDRRRTAERVNVGLLGADWEIADGRYRLRKVYATPDWTQEVWPPLGRAGVNARAGEYLLQVDGRELTAQDNLYSFFEGLAGKTVPITLASSASGADRREVLVTPVGSESTLRYRDWVEGNRLKVEELSGGRVGYLHLPDTYTGSTREFPPYFYGQTQKQGMIVDGRFNGGGLDPDIFLQRLDKELHTYWTRRYSVPQTTPYMVTRAHLACLTNKYAGSGGDMLPMEFRMRNMGPIIGTRTWGGLVGVSMFYSLIDGGGLTAPDYRVYTPDGRWIVENEGVVPDIEVDLSPSEVAAGVDAQLQKAVEVLLEKIEREPRKLPTQPAFPDESKAAWEGE